MDTITATVIATLTGGVIGELQRRRLNSLAYRHPDEAELPAPGSRWWVSISLAATMGALVWRYPSIGDPWPLLFLLPVAVAAPWLAAVDLDVQRLPRTTTRATTLAAVIGIAITAATHQVADALVNGAFGYGVAYVLFWMIWRFSHGGLGYGDVRLAALIALTTMPLTHWATAQALLVGSLGAAIWAIFKRSRRHIPYGPWLLAGWFLGVLIP